MPVVHGSTRVITGWILLSVTTRCPLYHHTHSNDVISLCVRITSLTGVTWGHYKVVWCFLSWRALRSPISAGSCREQFWSNFRKWRKDHLVKMNRIFLSPNTEDHKFLLALSAKINGSSVLGVVKVIICMGHVYVAGTPRVKRWNGLFPEWVWVLST